MYRAYKELQKKILIIDDDVDLLMLLERSLGKQGYLVDSAASLPEAEEIISYFKPDLVLLDINVNGEDGRQLCWKLKKGVVPSKAKVVIMSGYDCDLSRAVLFGADDLVAKPFHQEFLLNKVKVQLEPGPMPANKIGR